MRAPRKPTVGQIVAAGWLILAVAIVFLFVSDAKQDEFDKQRGADIAAANAETVRCVVTALRTDAAQTKELREAAQMRDADLVGTVKALIQLVQERVLDQVAINEPIIQAANQLIAQGQNFLEQSEVLEQAREDNPIPNKICGVLIEDGD